MGSLARRRLPRTTYLCLTVATLAACGGAPTAPTALTLSQTALTAARNTTVQLTLQARDGATADVTHLAMWSSSNPTVATVTAGLVSVVGLGPATISAQYRGRTVSATITGRRGTFFDAEFFVRAIAPDETPIGGMDILLDGHEIITVGASGFYPDLHLSVRGDGPDKPIDPGHHDLAVRLFLAPGSHELTVSSSTLRIYDSDTGETLSTFPLAGQNGSRTDQGTFAWPIDVPTYTQ